MDYLLLFVGYTPSQRRLASVLACSLVLSCWFLCRGLLGSEPLSFVVGIVLMTLSTLALRLLHLHIENSLTKLNSVENSTKNA